MTKPIATLCGAVLLAFSVAIPASAQEINKRNRADPGAQSTINRAIPQSRATATGIEQEQRRKARRSCNQNIANVNSQAGARAPRQVITVIRGDVINVCR